MVDPTSYTDEHLFVLVSQDSEAAFTELYRRYWQRLFITANNILHDTDLAKDAVQNVFSDLWDQRHQKHVEAVAAYLKTATRYQVYNLIKRKEKDRDLTRRIGAVTADILNDNPLLFKEQEQLVNSLLASLPPDCMETFRLSRFENKTYKEIAQILKVSEKTVEYRMSRALKHLRKGMGFQLLLLACLAA